jgi:DNA-binding response OmpR family regulator
MRNLLSSLLDQAGFPTRQVASGEEALTAVRRGRPLLVILDIRLPGVSGYEVHHEFRNRFGAELPIIFISGERVESLDRTGGLLLGADDYVVKPFAPDELVARVQPPRHALRSGADQYTRATARGARRRGPAATRRRSRTA